jgi:hypothetical protein
LRFVGFAAKIRNFNEKRSKNQRVVAHNFLMTRFFSFHPFFARASFIFRLLAGEMENMEDSFIAHSPPPSPQSILFAASHAAFLLLLSKNLFRFVLHLLSSCSY